MVLIGKANRSSSIRSANVSGSPPARIRITSTLPFWLTEHTMKGGAIPRLMHSLNTASKNDSIQQAYAQHVRLQWCNGIVSSKVVFRFRQTFLAPDGSATYALRSPFVSQKQTATEAESSPGGSSEACD